MPRVGSKSLSKMDSFSGNDRLSLSRCHSPILGGCSLDPLHGQLGFVPLSTFAGPGKGSKTNLWSPSSFLWLGWPVAWITSVTGRTKKFWEWSQDPCWRTLGASLLPSDINHSVGNGPWENSKGLILLTLTICCCGNLLAPVSSVWSVCSWVWIQDSSQVHTLHSLWILV